MATAKSSGLSPNAGYTPVSAMHQYRVSSTIFRLRWIVDKEHDDSGCKEQCGNADKADVERNTRFYKKHNMLEPLDFRVDGEYQTDNGAY